MTPDELQLLARLETAAMHRLTQLEAARQRRLDARTAGRSGETFSWVESAEEEDDEETLAALTAFLPTRWWQDRQL
jgi:hypothetical protein